MSCGCSNTTSSTSTSVPYLFKGGRKRKTKRKQTKKTKKIKRKQTKKTKRKRTKGKPQRGGISIFGDGASNAVTISNGITGSFTGNSSAYDQPAGKSFGPANGYVV
jgi:hypothetical protein